MRGVPLLLAAALAVVAARGAAQDRPAAEKLGPQGQPLVVRLPPGPVEVSFVESRYGMRIYVKSGGVEVQGRRVYLGDGKVAVMFQADTNGWDSPDGRVNRAAVTYDRGATVRVPAARAHDWAAKNGEVYVLAPGLAFEVVGAK